MSRKIAREVAMKLIFARMLGGENDYRCILEQTGIEGEPLQEDIEFADSLVDGIEQRREEIASLFQECVGWTNNRMPNVDIFILRIALYEMMHRKIFHTAYPSRGGGLAKRFAGENRLLYQRHTRTLSQQLEEARIEASTAKWNVCCKHRLSAMLRVRLGDRFETAG